MKNKIIPILWILAGLLYLYHGLVMYWEYTQSGKLFFIVLPEYILTHHIVFGFLSLFVAYKLIRSPDKAYMFVYSFISWIFLLAFMHYIYELIKFGNHGGWLYCIPDFLMFIPIIPTLYVLKKENLIPEDLETYNYYERHFLIILIQSAMIFSLTILLADLFPYEIFLYNPALIRTHFFTQHTIITNAIWY